MTNETFTLRHLLWAVAFMVLGFGVCIWSPWRADIAPETRSLVARLHQATLDRLRADSSLIGYRKRSEAQSERIEALNASQRAHGASVARLAAGNARLVDSLQRLLALHPESAGGVVTELGRGIAALHVACEAALNDCDEAKSVLRGQVVMADSAFQAERARGLVTFRLAGEATLSATKWERTAAGYRRQRTLFGLAALILGLVVVVK